MYQSSSASDCNGHCSNVKRNIYFVCKHDLSDFDCYTLLIFVNFDIIQSYDTIIRYNHTIQSYNTIIQYNHTTQSYNTIIQYNHTIQSYNTIIQYNHVFGIIDLSD